MQDMHTFPPHLDTHGESMIRRPETAIRTVNPAPQLPAKQSKYFYHTPDATVNYDDASLFRHLQDAESTDEFAYGEANRLGTQAAYLNIPHTVSRTLVPLVLPSAKEAAYGNEPFHLPFPHLRKGDVAFYCRLEGGGWEAGSSLDAMPLAAVCRDWQQSLSVRRKRKMPQSEMGASLMAREGANIFVNLETANYILHGLQHYRDTEPGWRDSFWRGFGLHRLDPRIQRSAELLCTHVARHCMSAFGVVVSETTHASDSSAVAMVVDGRVEQVRNYWVVAGEGGEEDGEQLEVPQAGDELGFALERRQMHVDDAQRFEEEVERWTHVLPGWTHAGGEIVRAVFPIKRPPGEVQPAQREHFVWQLVPVVRGWGEGHEGKGFLSVGRVF